MNFKHSLITSNGTIGYTAFMQNGINKINMYNLSTPTATLIATFNNNGVNINP